MKTILKKTNINTILAIGILLLAANTLQAQGISTIFSSVEAELKKAVPAIKWIFGLAYFAQILWAGVNIWGRINDPQQGSVKGGILNIVIGVVITGVLFFIALSALTNAGGTN